MRKEVLLLYKSVTYFERVTVSDLEHYHWDSKKGNLRQIKFKNKFWNKQS